MRRAVTRVLRQVGRRRVRVTADRGGAAGALCTVLSDVGAACVIRVQQSPTRWLAGVWRRLDTLRVAGHPRRHPLGRRLSGASHPHALWGTMRRKREAHGTWGRWSVVAHRPYPAAHAVAA